MRSAAIVAAMLLSATNQAAAQRIPVPRISDAELKGALAQGEDIESRTDGDLNGDGDTDTVYVVRGEEKRTLHVMMAVRSEVELGHQPVGELALDAYPLGPATVSIAKGVLKIEDLTGGTTAIASIYRFRPDRTLPRMRLIGLDATLYSRTYAHDGFELSWNLLTGDLITRDLRLNKGGGDAAYDKVTERRIKRPSKAVYMEDAPEAEVVMGEVRGR
jgi:hypothetical protein